MIKKIFLIIIPFIIIGLGSVLIFFNNKKEKIKRVYSINTQYTYINKDSNLLNIQLFFNSNNISLLNSENITKTSLISNDKTIDIKLNSIYFDHIEKYMDEKIYVYNFSFNFFTMSYTDTLDDTYINIRLKNDIEYKYKIGTLKLINIDGSFKTYKTNTATSQQLSSDDIPRLKYIYLSNKYISNIEYIYIYNIENKLKYSIDKNNIKIEIPYKKYILYDTPLFIITKNSKYYIDNFIYFTSNNTLERCLNNQEMINEYVFK